MKELRRACRIAAFGLLIAASSANGMTPPAGAAPPCQVSNGEKLPAASGGSAELCAALERAAASRGLVGAFTVRVIVGPRSVLTADVTLADGRTLPSLRMAEMDRPIAKSTFLRFGDAVVNHVAGAGR